MDVDGVLARAGLGRAASVVPARAGERNTVWLVETDAGLPVVVRFLAASARLQMERRLLLVVGDAGIPVAETLWAETEPNPVLVQRRLPGRMLAEVEPTDTTCRSVAQTLRAIHAIPVGRGFGNLTAELEGETPSLSAWFVDHVGAEIQTPTVEPALADALAVLEAARPLLDRQRPALVHGDVQPTNLLVGDDGRVSGVLDWEAAKSGPPAFDFGWWDWFSRIRPTPWSTARLLERYGEVDDDTDELRRLVVLRVWTRELIAGTNHGDGTRAAAARSGVATALQARS